MAKSSVENFDRLANTLRKRLAKSERVDQPGVVVGYTQNYAIFVHEDPEAIHSVGTWKYLEKAARLLLNGGTLHLIITKAYAKTGSLSKSLLLAALAIQRQSQQLVPVDTGALKNSAFTRLDKG